MKETYVKSEAISRSSECDVVVVGAGFAGLYMHYRLRELGLSVKGFETGDGVGGTWYWNRYPGARVDVPSMQYSYSFSSELEQEWTWSENFSPQEDLEKYANHVADRFDLRRDIQFGTTVTSAAFDQTTKRWNVQTSRGDRVAARYFVAASGCLSATNVPQFKGLDSFAGSWYHTSRWPREGVDLRGKRVGVVGTGSTGIQAIPALAEQADHLYVFQRTASFSLPSDNKPLDRQFEREWKEHYPEHRSNARNSYGGLDIPAVLDRSALSVSDEERNTVFEDAWGDHTKLLWCFNDILTNLDANNTVADFVRQKIRTIVKDPEVAELLAPKDYPIGTKRICIDSGYFETFNRENVTLVDVKSNPIQEITTAGVVTTSDKYELDILVFATGFDAMTGPLLRMGITGVDGLTLEQKWSAGPRTFLGISTSGFPNMFIITGPGSPSVLSNMTNSIEQHVEWIADAIRHLEDHGFATIEATVEAEDEWVDHVNDVASKTLVNMAQSWYLGANIPGKPRVFMPYAGSVGEYRKKCDEVASHGYAGFELRA